MSALERMVARAGRRAAFDLALLGAGRGLAIGVGVGLALLVLDRATDLVVPLAAYPILVAVAVVIAAVVAILGRPSSFDIAVRLDRRLGLKDRLGTGVAIRQGRTRGELAELARLDAQRVAGTIDVRRATPIRVTAIWPVAVLLGVTLAAGVAFLPALDAAGAQEPAVTRIALEQQRTEIVETIDETMDALDQETLDTASRQDMETLERLAEQLGEPAVDEIELARLRDESAATMEEMADRLAEDAQRNLEVVDEVTRRFTEAEQPDAPSHEPPAELSEFLDAVRRGELGEAAERFDELLERADELPAPERDDVARELRELSERLDAPRDPEDPGGSEAPEVERLREALDDLGVDEQTMKELLDNQDRTPADDALDDPETRRRIAEDLDAARQRQQVREQADKQREALAEALENAADEFERRPQQPQPDQDPRQQNQDRDPDRDRGRGRQQDEQPSRQQRPGSEQSDEQARREGSEGDPGARQVPRPDDTAVERPQAVERPGQIPDERPGETPGAQPSVGELLRQLQRARQEADGKQADSERLREAARKLADTMTDEQKQQFLEQWMRMQGTDQDKPGTPPEGMGTGGAPGGEKDSGVREAPVDARPPPPAFEDVDLRDLDELNQQIIAEWLSDAPVEGAPTTVDAGGRAAVRRARNAAEQAVEQSVVPARYHEFIRRYFGRLEKSVDTPPPAKPDADGDTR